MPSIPYENLSANTKQRYDNALDKARRSGLTITELLELNDDDFRTVYDTKAKNLNKQRQLLKNLKITSERKVNIAKNLEKRYKDIPDNLKFRMKSKINKTLGSTFDSLVEQLKEKRDYSETGNQQLYSDARELLKIPDHLVRQLDETDQQLIEGYDRTP